VSSVSKSAVVPYTAEQMYNLVNDIDAYPEFLPWCTGAVVHSRAENRLTASVSLATGKLKQTFTTENRMQPGQRIDVTLISGPFKHLQGYWKFENTDSKFCRIELNMDFEFKNTLLKLTLSAVFNQFMNSLVGSFTNRAKQIYGE
jgi:ribosome-associated toxin RatA of RatAB toxin-antitoxin module